MSTKHFTAALVLAALVGVTAAQDATELDSYMLLSEEVVVREEDAAETVYHTSDLKRATTKLKEFGVKVPDSVKFPGGGLFLVVVTDHATEVFRSLSVVEKKHVLVVDLETDKDAKQPDAAPAGKKNSLVLLVACPPLQGIKAFSVKTGDGKVHEIKAEPLK